MQKTSLYESHRALGAKMISFGGWEMPRDYGSGTASEVQACRNGIGLFDVSHMGEFRVNGPEALDFLQHITTNDVSRLSNSKAQYSLLLNDDGGVKDDIIVYREAVDTYLVVVNAGCKDKDWDWFVLKSRSYDISVEDESARTALIAVQGPKARAAVQSLTDTPLLPLKRFHVRLCRINQVECKISRTGYTGEDGFEIFCDWDNAPTVWKAMVESGGTPCGLAARDVLRIEAAYPLYGHELKETEVPIGIGVGWAIKTSKLDFIGRHRIVSSLQDGVRTKLVGLKMAAANAIPREGQAVYVDGLEDPLGWISSGTLSPTVGYGIALVRISAGFAEPGTQVNVDIRGRRADAVVVELPFYRGLDQ